MAKIPFDVKYRPQIESGEYKVETRDGAPTEIVKWDLRSPHGSAPILAIIHRDYDYNRTYSDEGYSTIDSDRLFLITPEPELSEFEEAVRACAFGKLTNKEEGETKEEYVKRWSAELLELANKELKNHEFAIFTREEFDAEIEEAEAEALKDSPRWKKAIFGKRFDDEKAIVLTDDNELFCTFYVKEGEYYISFSELEKLPKEDEK